MKGKPYRSSLIPYEEEIIDLRRRRPPMPYSQIAELLSRKYHLKVCRETIFKFVRVRSRGRKVYSYSPSRVSGKVVSGHLLIKLATPASKQPPKPLFDFKFSDRYNLTRLPPEEAAARRKKLEEEGH
jgi:hypothetical protein